MRTNIIQFGTNRACYQIQREWNLSRAGTIKDGLPVEVESELSFERQVVGTQPSANQRPLLPMIPGPFYPSLSRIVPQDCCNKAELMRLLCLMRTHPVSSAETIAEEFNRLRGFFFFFFEGRAGSVF